MLLKQIRYLVYEEHLVIKLERYSIFGENRKNSSRTYKNSIFIRPPSLLIIRHTLIQFAIKAEGWRLDSIKIFRHKLPIPGA